MIISEAKSNNTKSSYKEDAIPCREKFDGLASSFSTQTSDNGSGIPSEVN